MTMPKTKQDKSNFRPRPTGNKEMNKPMRSLKPKQVEITFSGRAWLIKKMRAKIEELRSNIPDSAKKEQIDQFFDEYLNDPAFNGETSDITSEDLTSD